MKNALAWLLFALMPRAATDCFTPLFEKGKAAFDQKKYETAIVKWQGAMHCPDSDPGRQALLLQWIDLARERQRNPNKMHTPPRRDFVEKTAAPAAVPSALAGEINWSGQYVEAEGMSVIDRQRFPVEAQAVAMATRGAEVVAQANLLEIALGVRVRRSTTVGDLVTASDEVRAEVAGFVRGARRVGDPVVGADVVALRLRAPLAGLTPLAALPDTLAIAARSPGPRPEPVGWLLPGTPDAPLGLLLHFADGRFDPALALLLLDAAGRPVFDLGTLTAATGTPPDWNAPQLRVQAVQDNAGAVRIPDPEQQAAALRYLQARAEANIKTMPVVSFLP